jgi:hypothetical protein
LDRVTVTEFTRNHWVAVRCCCTPQKVLGFLLLSEDQVRARQFRTVHLDGPVTLRQFAEAHRGDNMELTVTDELAIYSDDRPIEEWRRVPGFVEVR